MLAAVDASWHAFIKISKFLRANHIVAPDIYHQDAENGFLLLEDFGDELLLKVLTNACNKHAVLEKYYIKAIDSLILMQKISLLAKQVITSNFDADYLADRLNVLFKDWYLNKYLQLT